MLPISALAEIDACSVLLEAADKSASDSDLRKRIEILNEARKRLLKLLRSVVPETYSDNLDRLDLPSLGELAAYLMFGDGDDQPRETAAGSTEKNGLRDAV